MRVRQIMDGVWHKPSDYIGCCDCGLIHRIEYRIRKGKVERCVWRRDRMSNQRRKKKKYAFKKI